MSFVRVRRHADKSLVVFFSGQFCISPVLISGPSVIDLTKQPQPWVDLSCSFSYIKQEYKELDIKWYFSGEEEPILQWVPSASKKPQTIGQTSNEISVDQTTRLSRKFALKDLLLIFLATTLARLPLSLPSLTTHTICSFSVGKCLAYSPIN